MKKSIVTVLVISVLWVPGILYAEDQFQTASKLSPREWYITEKLPSAKGLAIGVFLFEEGMPIEHIHDVFGRPQETITLDTEEGYYGTILVYPHHHFFFSRTGHLHNIRERNYIN